MGFKMKSGNSPSFKDMGSTPYKSWLGDQLRKGKDIFKKTNPILMGMDLIKKKKEDDKAATDARQSSVIAETVDNQVDVPATDKCSTCGGAGMEQEKKEKNRLKQATASSLDDLKNLI